MARFLLLVFVACVTLALSSAVPDLFLYGAAAGDTELPPNDDGSSPPILLQVPFPFFDELHSTVYVNNNGDLSFDNAVSTYTPNPFPLSGSLELIAPFWGDVDTRGTGQVWYRETMEADLIMRAEREVERAFINVIDFRPTSLFIATWDRVGYFSFGTNLVNTFQSVMATDGQRSFVLFLYNSITWTTGDASGGSNGVGGTPAQAGFNAGDGIRFQTIPGSRTSDIINVEETSNVNVPGLWIFRVDEEDIATGGCTEASEGRPLMAPRSGSVFGGTAVQVAGPCLDITDTVRCTFDGVEVEGVILNQLTAFCVSPNLTAHGRRPFTLTVLRDDGSLKYQGESIFYSLSAEERMDVEADYDSPLLRPDTTMELRWSRENILSIPDLEPERLMVDISIYEVDLNRGTLTEMATIARNIPNDGSAEVTIPRMIPQGGEDEVCPVAVRVTPTGIDNMEDDPVDADLLQRVLGQSTTRAGFWGAVVYYSPSSVLRRRCAEWCDSQEEGIGETLLARLPPCPPTVSRARNDAVFTEDSGAGSFLNDVFHPGAATCFRQTTFNLMNQGSGQQCCYGTDDNLLTGSQLGAGSVDRVAPVGFRGTVGHFREDVLPYMYCCWGEFADCEAYKRKRPADNGDGYRITPPACVYGDPHIVTLDGLKYTFNGKGEFVLVETDDASFTLQGRMIDALRGDGAVAPATVFSAIVARQSDSDIVQFETSRRGLDALVNGERVDFADLPVQLFNNVTVRVEERNDTLSATFTSGARVQVTAENGILSVLLVSLPQDYRDRTSGLMGNFNRDIADDFNPRNIPSVVSTDSSLRSIHFDFGITWIIQSVDDSLFTYPAGSDLTSFLDPAYQPNFDMEFTDPELQAQAEELCNGDQFCLFDVMATGRMDIGLSTLIGSEEFEEIVLISYPIVCNPPCENGACVANDTCSCAAGYEGITCNQPVLMECDVNPCESGETCAILAGSYLCASCSSDDSSIICTDTGLDQRTIYIIIGVCAGVGGLLLLGIWVMLICCCCVFCASKKQPIHSTAFEMGVVDEVKVVKDNPLF